MDDRSEDISIAILTEPWIVLRPVNKDSVEFLELRDSMDQRGLLNSICVRPSPKVPTKYEVIDGLYRLNAARDLRWTTIPCLIKQGVSDEDVIALQVQANAIRPETKPVEFARSLRRLFRLRADMTFAELAHLVHKTPTWVKDRLGLLDLKPDVQLMVDRGEIPVASAYMLAKIPSRMRGNYVEQARGLRTQAFRALAAGIIKQFTECVQQGKMDERYMPEFQPQPYIRPVREVLAELEKPTVGALEIVGAGCKSPLDAWNAAIRWLLHLDPYSVEEQRRNAEKKHRTLITERIANDQLEEPLAEQRQPDDNPTT